MELKEGGYDGLEWIHVAQYLEQGQRRGLGNRLMKLRIKRVCVCTAVFITNPVWPVASTSSYFVHSVRNTEQIIRYYFLLPRSGYSEPRNFYGT